MGTSNFWVKSKFWTKSKFWAKVKILVKKHIFVRTSILTKNQIFCLKFNILVNSNLDFLYQSEHIPNGGKINIPIIATIETILTKDDFVASRLSYKLINHKISFSQNKINVDLWEVDIRKNELPSIGINFQILNFNDIFITWATHFSGVYVNLKNKKLAEMDNRVRGCKK